VHGSHDETQWVIFMTGIITKSI